MAAVPIGARAARGAEDCTAVAIRGQVQMPLAQSSLGAQQTLLQHASTHAPFWQISRLRAAWLAAHVCRRVADVADPVPVILC